MPSLNPAAARLVALTLASLTFATTPGASIHAIGAPFASGARPQEPGASVNAASIVRNALDRIGGASWNAIGSYESIATLQSVMGDGRIEFRFVAPDARKLVQTMPGGKTALEFGSVGSVAWMGEPGRARAVDPEMAREMAGGGDLLTLVRSIDARFTDFRVLGKEAVEGVECWKVSMKPLQSDIPDLLWTVWISASDAAIVGLEIPAPPAPAQAKAPVQGGQSMRFRRWEAVERGADARPDVPTLLAFREATIVTMGMKVDIVYTRVAVDTLPRGAIVPPATLESPSVAPNATR